MKLIVGLGNPGKIYAKTRHNAGFMVLDKLREEFKENNISNWELSKKFNAEVCGCTISGNKIVLTKPMTFMNDSGQAVQLIAHFYKLTPADLIVIHDDKDIKLGEIKIQTNRSSAGHNGAQSIIDHIGTQNFTRVRVGVAPENPKKMSDTAKFVLNRFGLFERKKIEGAVKQTVKEVLGLIK
ncbi:MAG: aminoacyl-tRNA hydrolase [Candidatus Magasanikbacteria bacterium RIFCSPLOWO2_01_FULL_43_20b]|nr:MAG: aminoacyl-tRNA hydrolase [Candidatus Magasanikbacteria bacterium RIFCSPLOWO2_02_FULL_43_22]OGH72788.1 MAG: aminoacyl-tRNA hydrolase [Candidatus Magasanikbacteria bacterium RIFCSPLOWO2_01_FULL_43_20b]